MAFGRIILFLIFFLNYEVLSIKNHIAINKCCPKSKVLNCHGVCVIAESERDQNGFDSFVNTFLLNRDSLTTLTHNGIFSTETVNYTFSNNDIQFIYPLLKIRLAKENYDFFTSLEHPDHDYCIDYKSKGSMILRYSKSYNTCKNKTCLPVCSKWTFQVSKQEGDNIAYLLPINSTDLNNLTSKIEKTLDLVNKKSGLFSRCETEYKKLTSQGHFNITNGNQDVTFENGNALSNGSYCLEIPNLDEKKRFNIYQCVPENSTFWSKYKWYVIGGSAVLMILLLPLCIFVCVCKAITSCCCSCC